MAGRKAGGGNVQMVSRTPTAEPKKPGGSKQQQAIAAALARADPAAVARAEAATARAIAIEALERAMESRDTEVLRVAIGHHERNAADTDALWRATSLRKELVHQAKAAKKQLEKDVKAAEAQAKAEEKAVSATLSNRTEFVCAGSAGNGGRPDCAAGIDALIGAVVTRMPSADG